MVYVLMVGPHNSVKGGISTVVDSYLSWGKWENIRISYVPTYIEKNILIKIAFYFIHLLEIIGKCMCSKIDIIHVHMAERGSFYRKAIILYFCRRRGIKTVIHHHGAEFIEFYNNCSQARKKWIDKVLTAADINIVLSYYQKNRMELYFPKATFRVIYNSVSEDSENLYCSESTNVLFVGRLGKRKGVYDLLQAIKELDPVLPATIKLCLCGDGDIAGVKAWIKREAIESRIKFIGWCNKAELQCAYHNTMLFILPSYHEGLPMAPLEAMSCGIPCIGSNVDAIPEVINNGDNGLLITPGNVSEIKTALFMLIKNESFRKKMGERGYECVKDRFLIKNRVLELKKIYVTLVKES